LSLPKSFNYHCAPAAKEPIRGKKRDRKGGGPEEEKGKKVTSYRELRVLAHRDKKLLDLSPSSSLLTRFPPPSEGEKKPKPLEEGGGEEEGSYLHLFSPQLGSEREKRKRRGKGEEWKRKMILSISFLLSERS